jgi:protein-L-isoaspartate(D-aspartate) O-methyltransferase
MTETLHDMIEFDLKDRGISDERVLAAFRRIDRSYFVPQMEKRHAYNDRALILSHGQTISQPYIVALMTQALQLTGSEKVLEIGTGSGFQTGILSALARDVYTVERIEFLATTAEDRLLDLGIKNIHFKLGDGSLGWAEFAPYDRILVTAAASQIPQPFIDQLAEGGILVAPVGAVEEQELITAIKRNGRMEESRGIPCRFVKLIDEQQRPKTSGAK